MSADFLRIAAKFSSYGDASRRYHPLACHMLDVAAVAEALWGRVLPRSVRDLVSASLGLDALAARAWVAYVAALHDLGKACPAFQAKDTGRDGPGFEDRLAGTALSFTRPTYPMDPGHGAVTAAQLQGILEQQWAVNSDCARELAAISGGHHGAFPTSASVLAGRGYNIGESSGNNPWAAARKDLALAVAGPLNVPCSGPAHTPDKPTALALAGIITVSDWIGSNTDYFPYSSETANLHEYMELRARPAARRALTQLGWECPKSPSEVPSFRALFPAIRSIRPLQDAAISLAPALDQNSLIIIEAPMGEGKTEAALYIAEFLASRYGTRGAYIALPTQATSNQMFGRFRDFLSHRYQDDQVNIQLLHGHAALNAEFEVLKERQFLPAGVYDDQAGGHGAVIAAEWFTHRKRGLLAPFGVGTVDQALLGALQVRHVFVRLLGLAGKVVVIDEVHAYDTYMSALLERLMEWLAALRSPVVLLSATLPASRRDALMSAYERGLGQAGGLPAQTSTVYPYPRVSALTGGTRRSVGFGTSEQNSRQVRIDRVEGNPEALAERLRSALADGGCAAVVCNTADRAQHVYGILKRRLAQLKPELELDLFHARYMFKDRDEREIRCLENFGKPDASGRSPARPRRAVLVATQVIEQSLDLDFDLMVTDFAPADLLLQRSGRLQRHKRESRPSQLQSPCLWVSWPTLDDHGVPEFDGGTAAIYHPHVLLRTWLALNGRSHISVPHDVEALVEQVYSEDPLPPTDAPRAIHEVWGSGFEDLQSQRESEKQEAKHRWLPPPSYSGELWRMLENLVDEDRPEYHAKFQALTRLTGPSASVVFLYSTPAGSVLASADSRPVDLSSAPDADLTRDLLRNSMTISSRRLAPLILQQEPPKAWQDSALLRHHRLMPVDPAGRAIVGNVPIQLDRDLGLVIGTPGQEEQ